MQSHKHRHSAPLVASLLTGVCLFAATATAPAQTAIERFRDAQQRADEAWGQLSPEDQQAVKDQGISRAGQMKDAGEAKWQQLTPEEQEAVKDQGISRARQMKGAGEEKWNQLTPDEQQQYKDTAKDTGKDVLEYRKERFRERMSQ